MVSVDTPPPPSSVEVGGGGVRPTYELVPQPVPLLEERGGDDQAVDESKQNRPKNI